MKIRLFLLDKIDSITYDSKVPIILEYDFNNPIGYCEITVDQNGNHVGNLFLDRKVNLDLYFYYRQHCTDDGIFWLSGMQLLSNPLNDKPTLKLKDKIV